MSTSWQKVSRANIWSKMYFSPPSVIVNLWERDLSLDGQNMSLDPQWQIYRSPEERVSQRFWRPEAWGLAGRGSSAQRFPIVAKRDKSWLISCLTSLNICKKGRWSFDRQIYLDRKARWALLAGAEESRTMIRRPRRTGALGAFILFWSTEDGGVGPLIYKASYKGWSCCQWNRDGFLNKIEQLLRKWKNRSTDYSYRPWIHLKPKIQTFFSQILCVLGVG